MQSKGARSSCYFIGALIATVLSLSALPASASIISVNFESTVQINGIATAVDGNFLLDSSVDLVNGINDSVIVGGGMRIGDFEPDPILLDSFATFLNVADLGGPNAVGITGDDGSNFWGLDMFFNDVTSDNFFEFLLSDDFSVDNLVGASGGAIYEPFFVAFVPGAPADGAIGQIENLSVTVVGINEPASIALLLIGAAVIVGRRRRA